MIFPYYLSGSGTARGSLGWLRWLAGCGDIGRVNIVLVAIIPPNQRKKSARPECYNNAVTGLAVAAEFPF